MPKTLPKLDRKGKRRRWTKALAAETSYNSHLLAVAKQIRAILKGLAPDGVVEDAGPIVTALRQYAKVIEPWANAVAGFMLADVARRDKAMWFQNSKEMGVEMRRLLTNSPTGTALSNLQEQQVELIKSLPLEAAQRVHSLSLQSIIESSRASDLTKEILATSDIAESRARLIARTEVARASSNLLQTRATSAGSEGYVWRTSGDHDVRPSHRSMEGKYVRWDTPPTLDKLKGHAGTLPNCRCFAEPIFPNDD